MHKALAMKYRKIGVIGAGVIGVGVAQNLAQTGHLVVLIDISDNVLCQARTTISKELKFVALFDAKVCRKRVFDYYGKNGPVSPFM